MRALCSVRGPLAGEARGLAAGARLLAVRVPTQPQPLHFVVEAKARVRDLRAQAQAHFQLQGLTDIDIFGLAIMQNGEYLFIDLDSKLSKYAPKSWRSSHTHGLDANGRPLLELHLAVQFYVESPLLLPDDASRHLYFQQLRLNMVLRDTLPPEVLLLLTGIALQAEYGDADAYEDRDYFSIKDYAPLSLTGDWVANAMRACHKDNRGISNTEAELRFIREVCLLPDMINSHRFRLKCTKSEPDPGTVWLLVTAKGIKLVPDNGAISTFVWSSIGKLSFDRKKFEIRTEEGKVTLYSPTDDKCKYLFALCKETHQFSMKIAPRLNEILFMEEAERKMCYGYTNTLNFQQCKNKNEQRISVISSTSSNTTSGIVSDRVQSEDELEIMIDSPPAPSTESLAFAHLLDCSKSYFLRHFSMENVPLSKTTSLKHSKSKLKSQSNNKLDVSTEEKPSPPSKAFHKSTSQLNMQNHSPIDNVPEKQNGSPLSGKLKCGSSQCSSSCSTVIMGRAGLSALRRTSDASSLELGYSHTAQNSVISGSSVAPIDIDYTQESASALYDGLGQPVTIAASSETSGVYTMGSSEVASSQCTKTDDVSDGSRLDYDFHAFKLTKDNDLADFDSVSTIIDPKPKPQNKIECNSDCVDGIKGFINEEPLESEFRHRTDSNVSATSFHGDGSDPTNNQNNLLSASELSDLIVGRGVYPKRQSVSDTLDSVSDYVRLPLPLSGDSYLQGHEDTAPSDDNYPDTDDAYFDRPPTPPARIDSRKALNLSLPNILDFNEAPIIPPSFPCKPPPPYEFNHRTVPPSKAPDSLTKSHNSLSASTNNLKIRTNELEQIPARVVTTKPMITILKAETGEVPLTKERNFASPMIMQHRFRKSKTHQASNRRTARSRLAQELSPPALPSRETSKSQDSSVFVAMMKFPPPPPPRRARLPPPPPSKLLPPPPPPHHQLFHQQLYSDVDYVYYPMQDPKVSQQNYLDSKLAESRCKTNMRKNGLQYRSTPFLNASIANSSVYGSTQNLSDSYIQLPGGRGSLYSLLSPSSSISNHSMSFDRPPLPVKRGDITFNRAKSDENILSFENPRTFRRLPPPPPPIDLNQPTSQFKDFKVNENSPVQSEVPFDSKQKETCAIDIKTLREKSKNLDLPLISALCNDRSLLKQTKAFGAPKSKLTGCDCESDVSVNSGTKTTDSLDCKSKDDVKVKSCVQVTQGKKILVRNPMDKLPDIPKQDQHTPRAKLNTYVSHPGAVVNKMVLPRS